MTPREKKIAAILQLFLSGDIDQARPLAVEFLQQIDADLRRAKYEIRMALRDKGTLEQSDLRSSVAGLDRVTFDKALQDLKKTDYMTISREGWTYNPQDERDIRDYIQYEINPRVNQHGGSVSLIDYDDGEVAIEMEGGCQGCAAADQTLHAFIEEELQAQFGAHISVDDRTDHQAGDNPYFETTQDL
jgi:Fe-S cluster biogenesis protein NfuA